MKSRRAKPGSAGESSSREVTGTLPGFLREPKPRILILSAFAPELTELRRLLARADTPRAVRARVKCEPAGIGLTDAAVGAARALQRLRPDEVLFIGTAGSYGAAPKVGQVAIARSTVLASAAHARGQGYLPKPLVGRSPADPAMTRRLLTAAMAAGSGAPLAPLAPLVHVATPLAITTAPALARAHQRATDATVENLEAFGVARAAAAAGVPFAAVLGISNHVGPLAHEQWRRHQAAAMRAVAALVLTYLGARIMVPSR